MIVNCPFCNIDTAGNHRQDCLGDVRTETLTMTERDKARLMSYEQYIREGIKDDS